MARVNTGRGRPRPLGTATEAAAVALGGALLGLAAGSLLGPAGLLVGCALAGANGLISGWHGIYDWRAPRGWLAWILDSTWGLVGIAFALALHATNLFASARYRDDLSRRQNRHVYECGVRLKSRFAFTLGNTISNAGCNLGRVNERFIRNHEELHVWQARLFGPVFQLTYVAWAVMGAAIAVLVWLGRRDESLSSMIETAAYYDNPFEYWAYRNDANWPPAPANPRLVWRRRTPSTDADDAERG